MKIDLCYPFLLECCAQTNDMQWKNIFEDLAYGITPYGCFITKDSLACNLKTREFLYRLIPKDPAVLFHDITNLLRNKLNIMTREDIIREKEFIPLTEKMTSWSSIKKKNLRDALIEIFVIEKKNTFDLTLNQIKSLYSLINLGFLFKVLSSEDVIMNEGRIESIKGIDFQKCKINLNIDIFNMNVSSVPEIILGKKSMSEDWVKFLEHLQKNLL